MTVCNRSTNNSDLVGPWFPCCSTSIYLFCDRLHLRPITLKRPNVTIVVPKRTRPHEGRGVPGLNEIDASLTQKNSSYHGSNFAPAFAFFNSRFERRSTIPYAHGVACVRAFEAATCPQPRSCPSRSWVCSATALFNSLRTAVHQGCVQPSAQEVYSLLARHEKGVAPTV